MSEYKAMVILLDRDRKDRAKMRIDEAPVDHVMRISAPVRKREANDKFHAMIDDISKQVEIFGSKRDSETCKRLLIDQFVKEMRDEAQATGNPNPFPEQSDVMPSLDGKRIVQLGVQSRKFTVKQASMFVEYLYSFGSENNVVWSEKP